MEVVEIMCTRNFLPGDAVIPMLLEVLVQDAQCHAPLGSLLIFFRSVDDVNPMKQETIEILSN